MNVTLYPIRLGDRRKIVHGWIILQDGAARGLLTPGEDGEILFALAFDRRIRPEEDVMIFRDLEEAHAWLRRRLRRAPVRRGSEAHA
jgi:hypothetical protein